jgi:hypothetical protein
MEFLKYIMHFSQTSGGYCKIFFMNRPEIHLAREKIIKVTVAFFSPLWKANDCDVCQLRTEMFKNKRI